MKISMKMPNNIKFFIFLVLFFTAGFSSAQEINTELSWFKYFQAKENKIVGIWPHNNRWTNFQKLKEIKYRWGFNFLLVYPREDHFNLAATIGYPPSKIMVKLKPTNYTNAEDVPPSWAYYFDEVADENHPIDDFAQVENWFDQNYPDSKVVISGYKRNNTLIDYINRYADEAMFSSYKHWWSIFGFVWVSCCPENPDQRGDWTAMRSLFGSKFSMTWLGAHRDLNEYEDLMGHAKNIGLAGVWLYQLQPDPVIDGGEEVPDSNIDRFCEAATTNGFMNRYFQQVRKVYRNGILIKEQFVGSSYSQTIPENFNHSDFVFGNTTVNNNRIDDYFAYETITAGAPYVFIVPTGKKSSFNTENQIVLKPGFRAEKVQSSALILIMS